MRDLWRFFGFVGVLLALLVFLLLRSASPDAAALANMRAQLQVFELRDAELTRDALLARAGLLPNYDALLHDHIELREALAALRRASTSGSEDAAAALAAPLEQLSRALDAKLDDVEQFKADDALLRHSVAYLTYTISRMDARAQAAVDQGDLQGTFLRFVQTPNTTAGADFKAALDRVAGRSQPSDEQHALLSHGSLVVDLLPQVVALLRQIVAAPTTARVGDLRAQIEKVSVEAENHAQVFRYLLFVVSLVLLAYLVWQFARLRVYAGDLRRSNTELSRQIAEREQAEIALRTSEERFRAIAESAHDAIVSSDSRGAIVSWNPAAESIYGWQAEEILGKPLVRLMSRSAGAPPTQDGDFGGDTTPLVARTLEATGVRKDGREFPIEASLGSWTTSRGSFVTAIIRDVSARKALEEVSHQQELKLLQANKMAALGTLVSGVAHEINNPNQMVLLNSSVLADTWRDACVALDAHQEREGDFMLAGLSYSEMRGAAATLIRDVNEGARRIERIVADLKDFARPQQKQGPQVKVDLGDVVRRAVRLLAHLVNRRTRRLELDLADDAPAIRGDPQQIEQVLVNLIVNALESLPDVTRSVKVSLAPNRNTGWAVIKVIDQGIGIEPEHLQRLCDPFFTTKQDSGGTGLGLSVTFSLVQAHGGRLDFDSEPGHGTCVTVQFPPAVPSL